MDYFAFGSNMNLDHLRAWVRDHGGDPADIRQPRRAILSGHRLRTNYWSARHGAGAANVEVAEGQLVEGVVMRMTPAVRDVLRKKEGWPRVYEEVSVEVELPDQGTQVSAFTYRVNARHCLPDDQPVTPEYARLILDAAVAFDLSAAYRTQLDRLLRAVPKWG